MAAPLLSMDILNENAYRNTPKFNIDRAQAARNVLASGRTAAPLITISATGPAFSSRAGATASAGSLQTTRPITPTSAPFLGVYSPDTRDSEDVIRHSLENVRFEDAASHHCTSSTWLSKFGLKANHLDVRNIVRRIGFKHMKDFDFQLRKQVSSIYGDNIFTRFIEEDGTEYNVCSTGCVYFILEIFVTARAGELQRIALQLERLINLYQRRVSFLTGGSRRLFGLVMEHAVTVVLDFQVLSVVDFVHFTRALETLISEQLSTRTAFNLIRCSSTATGPAPCSVLPLRPECCSVGEENLVEEALAWVRSWARVEDAPHIVSPSTLSQSTQAFTSHAILDAIGRAIADPRNEAIYLVTNGVAVECCRELLKQKLKGSAVPVHVVAFNVPQPSTLQFLKYLASLTGGRFHAYQVQLQFELYEPMPYSDEMHAAPIGKKHYLAGWYPGDLVSGGLTARDNLLQPPKSPPEKGPASGRRVVRSVQASVLGGALTPRFSPGALTVWSADTDAVRTLGALGSPSPLATTRSGSGDAQGQSAYSNTTREDVIQVFAELENAREILKQIQTVTAVIHERMERMRKALCDESASKQHPMRRATEPRAPSYASDEYLSSVDWLKRYGINARRLNFYEFLKHLIFKHADGVIEICYAPIERKKPPIQPLEALELTSEDVDDDKTATDRAYAVEFESEPKTLVQAGARVQRLEQRLVNAEYCCELFAHVPWPNGDVMHVTVSPEGYRLYEERMQAALGALKRRLQWLKRGSRALFGTIVEEQMYVLIDTSASMQPQLQFIKDRIYLLLQEQLRHKRSINVVTFNNAVSKWRETLAPVTDESMQSMWQFVRELESSGTTDTLGALRAALADRGDVEAIYLLTDGRPNQPWNEIIAEVDSYRHMRVRFPLQTQPARARAGSLLSAEDSADPRERAASTVMSLLQTTVRQPPKEETRGGAGATMGAKELPARLFTDDEKRAPTARSAVYNVQARKLPKIHCISFNCLDYEANTFLKELARLTGGRFHAYHTPESHGPAMFTASPGSPEFESEDISLIEKEYQKGLEYLYRLKQLMVNCLDRKERRKRQLAEEEQEQHKKARTREKLRELERFKKSTTYLDQVGQVVARSQWMLPETREYLERGSTPRPEYERRKRREKRAAEKALKQAVRSKLATRLSLPPKPEPIVSVDTILATPPRSERISATQLAAAVENMSAEEIARKLGLPEGPLTRRAPRGTKLSSEPHLKPHKDVRLWLETHSLAAKRLTLADVLSPTFIEHNRKFIPSLKKSVEGRVFDIMPYAFVNKRELESPPLDADADVSDKETKKRKRDDIGSMKLVNPLAVDLKAYESRVEKEIPKFKKFLNELVWNSLSGIDRRRLLNLIKGLPINEGVRITASEKPVFGRSVPTEREEAAEHKRERDAEEAGDRKSPRVPDLLLPADESASARETRERERSATSTRTTSRSASRGTSKASSRASSAAHSRSSSARKSPPPQPQKDEESARAERAPSVASKPESFTSAAIPLPPDFVEYRRHYQTMLEAAGWPIQKEDVELLEKEIQSAEYYISKSREIRASCETEASRARRERERSAGRDAGKSSSPSSRGRARSAGRKSARPRTAGDGVGAGVSARGRRAKATSRSPDESGLTGGSGTEAAAGASSGDEDALQPRFRKGEVVIAQNEEDGLFYEATVKGVGGPKKDHFEVEFRDTMLLMKHRVQTVTLDFILEREDEEGRRRQSAGPSKSRSKNGGEELRLKAGDAVLVRAMNRTSGQFCWAPGVVEGLEMPPVPQATPSQKLARQKPTADPKQIKYSCTTRIRNLHPLESSAGGRRGREAQDRYSAITQRLHEIEAARDEKSEEEQESDEEEDDEERKHRHHHRHEHHRARSGRHTDNGHDKRHRHPSKHGRRERRHESAAEESDESFMEANLRGSARHSRADDPPEF